MSTPSQAAFRLHLPDHPADLDQDEEYCELEVDGERRRIRFHDYAEIYRVPGLYEELFAASLQCDSPRVVVSLLADALDRADASPEELRVLDLGAGNGMVGEQLAELGSGAIVGVDLLPEAKAAAERDRPGVYDAYYAVDLTDLEDDERTALERHDVNCLTCVAALGFDDIPVEAFATAFDLVADEGWVAFAIRERFIGDEDTSGFAEAITTALDEGAIEERARLRYTHRLSVSREPLPYVAVVGRKQGDLALA